MAVVRAVNIYRRMSVNTLQQHFKIICVFIVNYLLNVSE